MKRLLLVGILVALLAVAAALAWNTASRDRQVPPFDRGR